MLFKVALALLFVWGLGIAGVYAVGQIVHVLLLVGLMLLLLSVAKARETAARRRDRGRIDDAAELGACRAVRVRELHPARRRHGGGRGVGQLLDTAGYDRATHPLHFWVNDVGMVFFFALAAKEVFEATLPGRPWHRSDKRRRHWRPPSAAWWPPR